MDDKKITEFKSRSKATEELIDSLFKPGLQTNPFRQSLLTYNEASNKIKFKLKDLFR